MTKKTVKALTITISAILVISVVYLISSLITEAATGKTRTEQAFNDVVQTVQQKGVLINYYDFINGDTGLSVLRVYQNNDSVFIFPGDDSSDLQETASTKVYSSDLTYENNTIHIQASYHAMRPARVYLILKVSFVFALLTTILAGLMLVLIQIEEKKGNTGNNQEESEEEVNTLNENIMEKSGNNSAFEELSPSFSPVPIVTSPDKFQFTDKDKTTEKEENPAEENDDHDVENSFSEMKSEENTAAEEILNDETLSLSDENESLSDGTADFSVSDSSSFEENSSQNFDSIIENAKADDEEMITFDDFVLPVKEESDLKNSLEEELNECASNEKDLSLFLIKYPEINTNSQLGVTISEKIKENFLTEDMIFKYGTDGFAVIKAGLTIDEAEDSADAAFNELKNAAAGYVQQPFIGISSRTTRMLSAGRLIKEAAEALNHAVLDPESPVIGFHVDVEKYREFLKNSD